jgi:hypothetical protein
MLAIRPLEEKAKPQRIGDTAITTNKKGAIRVAKKDNKVNTLVEDFDDREDGYGYIYDNWLPDGWEDVSNAGHADASSIYENDLTWRVCASDGIYGPFSGSYFAYIKPDAAYGNHTDLEEQDEWLISPTIKLAADDYLYFQMAYSPGWTLVNFSDYNTFDCQNSTLEVNISDDNGQSWKPLWNSADEAKKLSQAELAADLLVTNREDDYNPVFVSLDGYGGKKVKIAFRFYGKMGKPVALDHIVIGLPDPQASYVMDESVLYEALSENTTMPQDPKLLIPFGVEQTWTNTSINANGFRWTYSDPESVSTDLEMSTKNLTLPAYDKLQEVKTPTLTALFETNESAPYQEAFPTMQAGGLFSGPDETGQQCTFGVGNYNYMEPQAQIKFNRLIGFHADTADMWDAIRGASTTGYDYVHTIGNLYAQPLAPYALESVYVSMYVESIQPDTELTMTITPMTEYDGYLYMDEPIATATCYGSEIGADLDAYVTAKFDFSDNALTIDTPIMVTISGFDFNDSVCFPTVFTNSESYYGSSYIAMDLWDSNSGDWYTQYVNIASVPFGTTRHAAGILMGLNATYSWLDLLSVSSDFDAEETGDSKQFVFDSFYDESYWQVTDNGSPLPDWISYDIAKDAESGHYTLTLTCASNDTRIERSVLVKVLVPGANKVIYVHQNPTNSVASISESDGEAIYYDVYGRRVEDPDNGVYVKVTRLASGKTVAEKVMKK